MCGGVCSSVVRRELDLAVQFVRREFRLRAATPAARTRHLRPISTEHNAQMAANSGTTIRASRLAATEPQLQRETIQPNDRHSRDFQHCFCSESTF